MDVILTGNATVNVFYLLLKVEMLVQGSQSQGKYVFVQEQGELGKFSLRQGNVRF